MTERQRLTWLLSMPACAEMTLVMLDPTGVSYGTGEQNKDMTKSRQAHDMKYTRSLLYSLAERNPFTPHQDLINIMNGVHADSSVNVENAKEIGQTGFPTCKDICDLYCNYVTQKYGGAIVVFDCYTSSSTKDMTQQRRAGGKTGTTVTFSDDMKVTMKKDHFLSNSSNKQFFINMLSSYLQTRNSQTRHSQADADPLIVQTSVESARRINTVLVGDDTDLLILLCYHTELDAFELFFKPEPKANSIKRRVWNMKVLKEKLSQEVCSNTLFIHAILGCDTTSHLYSIDKGVLLKMFFDSQHFRDQAQVFNSTSVFKEDVVPAGEKALVCVYNGKSDEGLDSLRYRRYCEKVATNTSQVQPQSLPPTSAAARYHSLHVYFQVQQWRGFGQTMSAEEWGWKVSERLLLPIHTYLQHLKPSFKL